MYLRPGPPGYYIDHNGQLIPENSVNQYVDNYYNSEECDPGKSPEGESKDHDEEWQHFSEPFYNGTVTFGAGFTPKELVSGGMISGLLALLLGAGIPGALVMGMGSMIAEAGSTRIIPGWKRYALGLFRKPH